MLPPSLQNFIKIFGKLPGLGPRAANRLAFYLVNLDRASLDTLIQTATDLRKLNKCRRCLFVKETNQALCSICSDRNRVQDIIAIIEKETDLITLEKTATFRGTYFIVGELNEKGVIDTAQKMRLQYLKNRIKAESNIKIKEIIVAVNPNPISDILYDIIVAEFNGLADTITRLGRGIPTGGEIEFADEETIRNALERRS